MEKNKPQAKAQPQPQPQPQVQTDEEFGMTKKEALDILLKEVAESKKQFALGYGIPMEVAFEFLRQKRQKYPQV